MKIILRERQWTRVIYYCHYIPLLAPKQTLTLVIEKMASMDWTHGTQRLGTTLLAPRFPDMTPCDFLLWGYVKERVYVPPLPADLYELTNRITAAVKSVTEDILRRVWDEFSYWVDVALQQVEGT